ncbi:MAG TPA: hypothetical protein VJI70_01380 [Candidatus Paceibacterota bacterium]
MNNHGMLICAFLMKLSIMSPNSAQQSWEKYREREISKIIPVLKKLGFELEPLQPHAGGERYLMQAVTTAGGKKLILLGRRKKDGTRVVIKTTNDNNGIRELEHERKCRRVLQEINFTYQVFHSPSELFFGEREGRLISIQQFIEQESTFLARPIEEQFSIALKAFKAQEGAHATTYGHERLVRKTFGSMNATTYLDTFEGFKRNIFRELSDGMIPQSTLDEASKQLAKGREVIEQYGGFLTHTDFVPHNIRVRGGKIYLLDHSSLRFGNKYEGWARFVNFMTLYNPSLADALIEYVRANRTPEESLSLKLMRIYRLGEIIWYYTNTLEKSSGSLHILNEERVRFWARILAAVLHDEKITPAILDDYCHKRDTLRSEDEKLRQKNLH